MKTCRRGSARERNVGRRKHQRRKLRRRTWRKEEVQGGGSAGERSPAKSTGEAFVQTERGTSPSTRCRPKATGFHVDEALCPACANQGPRAYRPSIPVVHPALCADGHGAHHDPATLGDAMRLRTICGHWSPGGVLGAGCHLTCCGAGPRKLSSGEGPKGNLGPPQYSWKSENIGVSLFNLI